MHITDIVSALFMIYLFSAFMHIDEVSLFDGLSAQSRFTLWVLSPIVSPFLLVFFLVMGVYKFSLWWTKPLNGWLDSFWSIHSKKQKPTWDDLEKDVEALWRDVQNIGKNL